MLNYQTEKFQYWQQEIKISCHILFISQPLNHWHGRTGGADAGRIILSLKLKLAKKQKCKVQVLGVVAGFALPMITTMSNKDSATMTGTFIIIFILNLLFLVVLFGRKRDLSQHSQTRTSWTHSLALARAGPARAAVSGVWGVDYALALRGRQTRPSVLAGSIQTL